MPLGQRRVNAAGVAGAALGGLTWLAGGESLLGPLLSILLPLATAISRSKKEAFACALVYYLSGSVSMMGAIAGYYGTGHFMIGALAWIGAAVALALPWTLGRSAWGRLFALIATAIPPVGIIGWLSPLNAAGVLFPHQSWLGLVLLLTLLANTNHVVGFCKILRKTHFRPQKFSTWLALFVVVWIGAGQGMAILGDSEKIPPAGWIGLLTRVMPARGDLAQDIRNRQALIDAALTSNTARAAQVVVFPEAVLDGWRLGAQRQFAAAAPAGQTWLIGAQVARGIPAKSTNAVVSVGQGNANPQPLTEAIGLLLGGNWTPWSDRGLKPSGGQMAFALQGQRVWAALCVEQLQPWTWLLAMRENPTVILAMSNAWWAPAGSFAPRIQVASTKAWARLMNAPVIHAINR